MIGQCINWLSVWYLQTLSLKIQSISVFKSSCENFSLFFEAKCLTVWKIDSTLSFIKKIVHKNCNVTCKHYSKRIAYQCLLLLVFLGAILLCTWHFASASRLKFSHDDFKTDNESMKFAYQTESQPIHWPIVFRVRSMGISSRFYKTRGQ